MAKKEEDFKVGEPIALQMMQKAKSVKERASAYFDSIKRNLQRDIIDKLVDKKDKIEDELFELKNMNLETDLNRGLRPLTKEDLQERFSKIINLEYELKLLTLEIETKTASFQSYFGK